MTTEHQELEEIVRAFAFLEKDFGFDRKDSRLDTASFGDCLVEYRSGSMALRALRDRGQYFVELSPLTDPLDWYEVSIVLEALDLPGDGGEPRLQEKADAARRHLPALVNIYGSRSPEELRQAVRAGAERRARRRFGRLLEGSGP